MIKPAHKYLVVFFVLIGSTFYAQNDTIRLRNNDILIGEIKSIFRGVLTLETSYSDTDFKIEFNKLEAISIHRKCIITLTNNRFFYGNLRSETPEEFTIFLEDVGPQRFQLNELIELVEISDNYWERFKGSLDLGLNLTKANNNTQFTIAGGLNYIDESWRLKSDINLLHTSQDSVADIKRTSAMLEALLKVQEKWYLLADVSLLSNTEQALIGRISPSLGIVRSIKSTNKLFFNIGLGATYNDENYVDTTLNKNSMEAFLGSSFNMYNFKDFEFDSGFKFYVGLSEKGRLRTDYNINLKYDLPWNFYIKVTYILNYDNQPAIEGAELDYIFTSGFGYKFG